MAIPVKTDYADPIEIGTHADDNGLLVGDLYIELPTSAPRRMVLSQSQALELASTLLQTVSTEMTRRGQPAADHQ